MTQRSFEYDIRCGEQRYVSVVWRVTMISFDLLSATNPTQAVSGVTQIHKDKCRERETLIRVLNTTDRDREVRRDRS